MKYARFEDLPVWKASMDLAVRVFALTEGTVFRGHFSFRDQIERAVVSISNNIAEGFERGTTQELLTFLDYARGSAGEVRSMLHLMERRTAFEAIKPEIPNLRALAEGISRQLRAWADSLQNSEIKGQRFLTDRARQETDATRRREAFLNHLQQRMEEGQAERRRLQDEQK